MIIGIKRLFLIVFAISLVGTLQAEDGYRLWLRYDQIKNVQLLQQYRAAISSIQILGTTPTSVISKEELINGLENLLGKKISVPNNGASILAGTAANSALIRGAISQDDLSKIGKEGFIIRSLKATQKNRFIITANTDIGVLYGVFHFLRLLQTNQSIQQLSVTSSPKIKTRILNHWDNLNRTVERGYAGISIWDWQKLPEYIDQRYIDYARANASIGINGTVLTNVNANALILTNNYLEKVAALANTFRPYGLKVYLTARFSAPIEIGKLKTADPLDTEVREWWKKKIDSIYTYIPDFGGFLVKANSEGQPGPQNYGRDHADGANMLADALAPHNGIVMWRAFVYSNETPEDRFKQAYNEFKPLDGRFRNNVLVQVKNGPIDFQPREPFHPLFGAMPKTPLMMEFQITKEYLGFATHLVYLGTLYEEALDSDTWSRGKGSTVARVVDGSLNNHTLNGMAGVSNIGNDINWTGHPFAQSNWYALGRLSWDYSNTSDQIANEWLRMTFSNDDSFVK